MSDQIEYRDENGNLVDPAEIGDYEAVDSAPKSKRGRVIAASVAAVALLAGGAAGTYYVTGERGDAPAPAVASAPQSVSSVSVVPSSAASSASSMPPAANGINAAPLPPLVACTGGVDDAKWEAGAPRPQAALKVIDSVELPSGFTGRTSSQKSDAEHRVQILQTAPDALGIYWDQRDSGLGPKWWKVAVETHTGRPVVAGEGAGTGTDRDFRGACTSSFESGTYLVTGRGIPGGAQATEPGQIPLSALKVDASSLAKGAPQVAWAVAGNRLLKTELVRVGAGTSSSDASSSESSTAPSDGGA